MAIKTVEVGLQIPLLDGVSAVPTPMEIGAFLGIPVTHQLYQRLLDQLVFDQRPWKEILADFMSGDRTPDHSWTR